MVIILGWGINSGTTRLSPAAVRHNGASFAVVTSADIEVPADLRKLDAQVVIAPEAVSDAYAIVVRPDRYVAAVANSSDDLSNIAKALIQLF